MAALLYVLPHSTEDPDRAHTALATALAAQRAGHDVVLWLTGEGIRLGIRGVAETLREPGPQTAGAMTAALVAASVPFFLERGSFERRQFEPDMLLPTAEVADADRLASLLAEGRAAVTL